MSSAASTFRSVPVPLAGAFLEPLQHEAGCSPPVTLQLLPSIAGRGHHVSWWGPAWCHQTLLGGTVCWLLPASCCLLLPQRQRFPCPHAPSSPQALGPCRGSCPGSGTRVRSRGAAIHARVGTVSPSRTNRIESRQITSPQVIQIIQAGFHGQGLYFSTLLLHMHQTGLTSEVFLKLYSIASLIKTKSLKE